MGVCLNEVFNKPLIFTIIEIDHKDLKVSLIDINKSIIFNPVHESFRVLGGELDSIICIKSR